MPTAAGAEIRLDGYRNYVIETASIKMTIQIAKGNREIAQKHGNILCPVAPRTTASNDEL